MNLQELAKMANIWPEGTPQVISQAYETRRAKAEQARREQQPFVVPKNKDYGSEYPVTPYIVEDTIVAVGFVSLLSLMFMSGWWVVS